MGDLSYEEIKLIASGVWIAPAQVDHGSFMRGVQARLRVTPQREEEKMTDKAVELLAQQRFEEAQAKAQTEAEAIVAKVKALQVDTYINGDKVMFTKTMPTRDGMKTYTYLALRVVEGDKKMWFVTNQPASLNDFAFESLLARDGGFDVFTGLAVLGPPQASNYMGWGADVNKPDESTHAVGPAEPGEE